MMTRTAAIRAAFDPHLSVFAADHRSAIEELLRLAEVGERAQALLASFSMTTQPTRSATKPAPARAKTKTTKRSKKTRTKLTRPKTAPEVAPPGESVRVAGVAPEAGGPTLRDVILRVLGDAKKPLPLAEIEAAVKATGYTSASKAFSKLLAHTITMMKKELGRAGRGVYGLA